MDKLNIILEKKQRIFFTSDLHFGHRNVITFCNRPYSDVKEMECELINNWNKVVSERDIVFSLGDMFWFNDKKMMTRVLNQLNGKNIYLIMGNHCDHKAYDKLRDNGIIGDRIQVLSDVVTVFLAQYINTSSDGISNYKLLCEMVLSHYPLMTWSHRDKNAINLFGHIHSGPNSACDLDQNLPFWKGKQYDVGTDNNEYTPIELNKVLLKLKEDL